MDISLTAALTVPLASSPISKSLSGQSNFAYSYDTQGVKAIFEAVGVTDIKNKEATAAVLSYLFPQTYPGDFFQGERVRLSDLTRDVEDNSREGIIVQYKNSFGWGEDGGFGEPLGQPHFTALDITVTLKAQENVYLPQVENFTSQHLNNIILGARLEEVSSVHLHLHPFRHYHWYNSRDGMVRNPYAVIHMAPRDHTFAKILDGEILFREVLATLKESQPEFEQYGKLVESESKGAIARQKLAGIHSTYVQAFEGTGINVDTIAEYSLNCSEPAGIQSLEQLAGKLKSKKANTLDAVSQRFVETGLRDRLADYFMQDGLKMEPISKRYFDDEP